VIKGDNVVNKNVRNSELMIAAIKILPVFLYRIVEIEIDKRNIGTAKYNNWIKKNPPNRKHTKRTIKTRYISWIPKIDNDIFNRPF